MDFAINKNTFGGGKDHQIIISTRLQKEALKPTNYGSFSSSTMDIFFETDQPAAVLHSLKRKLTNDKYIYIPFSLSYRFT